MLILERAVFKILSHVDLTRSRTQSQHKGFGGYVFYIPHINTSKLEYFKSNPRSLCFNTLMDLEQKQCAALLLCLFFFCFKLKKGFLEEKRLCIVMQVTLSVS